VERLRRLVTRFFGDQRLRFLFFGGINTAVGYGLFVLSELSIGHWIGYIGSLYVSYLLGVTSAFVLHRRFTFRAHETGGSLGVDFLRFASVYVLALVVNTVGLPLLVEFGHLVPIAAQLIMVVITTVISYLAHTRFSFRRAVVAQTPVDATKSMPSPATVSDVSSTT
jgi:putative flippase GtrA